MFIIGSCKSGLKRANNGCIGLCGFSHNNKNNIGVIIMEKHQSRKDNQDPDEAIITYPKTVEFPKEKCSDKPTGK